MRAAQGWLYNRGRVVNQKKARVALKRAFRDLGSITKSINNKDNW